MAIGIETFVLDKDSPLSIIIKACRSAKLNSRPVAILVKKDTFLKYETKKVVLKKNLDTRENALKLIVDAANKFDYSLVSTTGVTSRELFEYRASNDQSHSRDFLTVGGMGHASQIAFGISLFASKKKILCIDGDGAFLMHTGGIAEISARNPKNFKHIVINNGCHDSVGGQPTSAKNLDLTNVASAFGYTTFKICYSLKDLEITLPKFLSYSSLAFLEIKVNPGFRKNLGRPTTTPIENKKCFMESLQTF